ncbi:MAG: hypothetical protein IMY72_00510 [Bacteroidetes bacterium]|nr:hypothetical protein [Bacteroidota bacterium]
MEKIQKFENCKIQNMQEIKGGRCVDKYDSGCGHTDKTIYDGCGNEKRVVTNIEHWFYRD